MIKEHDNFIYFLRIMTKFSDQYHPLSVNDIIDIFEKEFGEKITKQTVYNYLRIADNMDIEISSCKQGKYLSSRNIEDSEATFLIHSVVSNPTLSENYTFDLIEKIKKTQSIYYDSGVTNIYIADKKDNKSLFLSIDTINHAINEKLKISFEYTRYNLDGEVVPFRDKKYTVSPLFIICRDAKFYLVCKYDTQDTIMSFRIDKIYNIKVTDYKIEVNSSLTPAKYAKNRLYMYNGDIEEFIIRCDLSLTDVVYESFGKNIRPYNVNANTFEVKVKATVEGIKFFASQFLNKVTILYPLEVKEKMKEELKNALAKY